MTKTVADGVWEFLLEKGCEEAKGGGGCHIILRFFWRFLMIQHKKKKTCCVYLSFVNEHVPENNCLNKI